MSEREHGNKPVETLRDGALKVAIFRNETENGPSYSMVPGRIYTDKDTGQVHEATSFSGNEALRVAHLMTKGHERVMEYRTQDRHRRMEMLERGEDQNQQKRSVSAGQRRAGRENGFDRER